MSKTAVANRLDVMERKALKRHEQTIEEGKKTFVEVGNALAAIRDEKLYRETHKTFEAYTKDRWGYAKSRVYQLIEAAGVVSTIVDESNGKPDSDFAVIKPANEAQARILKDVPKEERAEVLQEAAERNDGKPTAAAIREVIAEREEEAEAEEVTDSNGEAVPEKLVATFEDGKEFDALARELAAIEKRAEALSSKPAGVFFHLQSFTTDIANAKRNLRQSRPECVCPYCTGTLKYNGKACAACRKVGLVTKHSYKTAPAEMRV